MGKESLSSCVRHAEPEIVYTPLSSAKSAKDNTGLFMPDDAKRPSDPFVRAENEDDDGYDPYSDRVDVAPLFERNPWD